MNEENNIQNLEEKRRQKAKSFTLNIQDDIYDESAKAENNEPEELNSYSGEDVKEQMAKNSKQALKKKKKIDKKLSKAKNKRNRRVFRVIWLVSVIIVGAMAGMFFVAGIDDMLAINRTEEKNVRIEIPANPPSTISPASSSWAFPPSRPPTPRPTSPSTLRRASPPLWTARRWRASSWSSI